MGCDGGTIPKRNEVVKNKQKDATRDKNADLSAKWQFCSLSGLRLKKPIVSCRLGRLFNKDAVIEHLLESRATRSISSSSKKAQSAISHIRSLKEVKELKLKEKPEYDKNQQASASGVGAFKAQFVCPISGLDINGKYKFYYLTTCGCVFSEKALKEVPNDKQCIVCFKSYNPEYHLITLNGTDEEVQELESRLSRRKEQKLRSESKSRSSSSPKHSRDLSPTFSSNKDNKKLKIKYDGDPNSYSRKHKSSVR